MQFLHTIFVVALLHGDVITATRQKVITDGGRYEDGFYNGQWWSDGNAPPPEYTNKSVVRVWAEPEGNFREYAGLEDIASYLSRKDVCHEDFGEEYGEEFYRSDWMRPFNFYADELIPVASHAESSGMYNLRLTHFLYVGESYEILRQTIWCVKNHSAREELMLVESLNEGPTQPDQLQAHTQSIKSDPSVFQAWQHHVLALHLHIYGASRINEPGQRSVTVDKLMLDYTDDSVVFLWESGKDNKFSVHPWTFNGLYEIRNFFYYESLQYVNGYEALMENVDEEHKQVFHTWRDPGTSRDPGYLRSASDTITYDDNFKILYQFVSFEWWEKPRN